jgi:hypothetical protein
MSRIHFLLVMFLFSGFFSSLSGQSGQISINRIEMMPFQPSPYSMRDWKEVAMRYDSTIYNINHIGQYWPIISIKNSGYNYPGNEFFNMQTYVGSNNQSNNEAINSLPSLVGATLVGIDKSNQFNKNWVRMSQDFFNKKNNENIYLNGNNTSSGHDWWYDMMPNIYFYQLCDLYPNIGGDKDLQFIAVADQMLKAVKAMGGSDRPWSSPSMNYRAWNFQSMMPLDEGVIEPEAAGAFAWLLYNAYLQTGQKSYLNGALWSLDFLQQLTKNPSYELQLPYGTYIAARINAELGTEYDIQKFTTWSFDRGHLRGWGTIVGKWGGMDVSGLVGEANDNGNDYAFQLNGVQQAAALVPMVRYDKRFANAIGKWMLNLANATRLFYPGFLPAHLQDGTAWSDTNDPERIIGYEALREKWNGQSPFSTGDAVKGGWAATNLSLYSTSSIGYLGAIVEKTNVDKILRLNLNKTDFFQEKSYPTYLYFNPYDQEKKVAIDLGSSPKNIYESLSESWPIEGQSGIIEITIPAKSAVIATITPTNPILEYDQNKLLANGIVIDYQQSHNAYTYSPHILALAPKLDTIEVNSTVPIYAKILDKDSNAFSYEWSSNGGHINGLDSTGTWTAPDNPGVFDVMLRVMDEAGNIDSAITQVTVISKINVRPEIIELKHSSIYTSPLKTIEFSAVASDANGDTLSYSWTADKGGFSQADAKSTVWTAPAEEGTYEVQLKVTDPGGLSAISIVHILVQQFEEIPGDLVAWLPFSGNGLDSTTFHHDGTISGALFISDIWGVSKHALTFDGVNDYVKVTNTPELNFQEGITVSCWIKPKSLPEKESFILSHGSWQNRWKLSITPERLLRWTVNTVSGIADIDAPIPIESNQTLFVTATYDGKSIMVYVNGSLAGFKALTGKIRQTNIPLLVGQMTPDESSYNFNGLIDEVMIYNHPLIPTEIDALYHTYTSGIFSPFGISEKMVAFPNPASSILYLNSSLIQEANTIEIVNVSGKIVFSQNINNSQLNHINIGYLNPGTYFIKMIHKNGIFVQRWEKI